MKRARKKTKVSRRSFNGNMILKLINLILCITLVVCFIQAQLEISSIKNQLVERQEQIKRQKLLLKDLRLFLREDQHYKEWLARKQGLARPEERLFVDVSGIQ